MYVSGWIVAVITIEVLSGGVKDAKHATVYFE